MARFLQFQNVIGKTVWINPDCVVGVTQSHIDEHTVAIVGADSENPWFVPGTVADVLAKLQGELRIEPAKAADDVVGWWVWGKDVIYVIGFRPDGRMTYLWDGGRATTHGDVTALRDWTRDPNRKGWEG